MREIYNWYIGLCDGNAPAAILLAGCVILVVGATIHAAFFEDSSRD